MSSELASSIASRASTIPQITNALKFFALALLIVEGLIAILAFQAPTEAITFAYLGTIMFVFVVAMVVLLVFKRARETLAVNPEQLTAQVREREEKKQDLEKKKDEVLTAYSPADLELVPSSEPAIAVQTPRGRME